MVRGTRAVEYDDPPQRLGNGWMMLTLGVRLRRDERAQRALIADLDGLGASCLGFGVGAAFKDVP